MREIAQGGLFLAFKLILAGYGDLVFGRGFGVVHGMIRQSKEAYGILPMVGIACDPAADGEDLIVEA